MIEFFVLCMCMCEVDVLSFVRVRRGEVGIFVRDISFWYWEWSLRKESRERGC